MINTIQVTVSEVIPGQRVEVYAVIRDSATCEIVSQGKNAISGKSSVPFTFSIPMEDM